jgi:3-oxoacyl-[acyl-carrier protein] reductase
MTKRFEGRRVVITGAAGGMGLALAQGFAREGAELILLDIAEAGMAETAEAARAIGAKVSTWRIDLSSEREIEEVAAQICKAHPKIEALINNAGLAYGEIARGFMDLSQEKWLKFLAINTLAPLLLAKALKPSLVAGRGNIINQSSMASNAPGTAYGITKAALNAMTFGMAHAFGADGIRVNAIEPGIMETPASKESLPAEHYAQIQGMQILKLHGTAEDIANLALFLASDDARFITCEIVSCDAGSRLRGWRY